MEMNEAFNVSGIIHCHSNFSYDGQNSLEDLCIEFRKQGFQFVALTEHSRGISQKSYKEFVARCNELSSSDFVAIPGLEILCPDGTEIAGVGLDKHIEEGSAEEVVAAIRDAGGFAIWVHPLKRRRLPEIPYASHAIEILNGKEDGTLAPNLRLLLQIMKWRKSYCFFVVAGLDLHMLGIPLNVWVECRVAELSGESVMKALDAGLYVNKISGIKINASCQIKNTTKIYFLVMRFLYLFWGFILSSMPDCFLNKLTRLSSPIISWFKIRR